MFRVNPNHDARGRFASGGGARRGGTKPAVRAAQRGESFTPLPPAPPGHINLYHGTTPENADSIVGSQGFHSYQSTWVNTSPDRASSYRAVVAVTVPVRRINSQIKAAGKRDNYDVALPRGMRVGKIVRVK